MPTEDVSRPEEEEEDQTIARSNTMAMDEDNEVHILTAAEAAIERAAAARNEPTACRKRKRLRVQTQPEPTECTICCEACTIVGRHRLVALKCGHLFGRSCIERWITERHTCPNCIASVACTDICLLFSHHAVVVDNTGLEAMTRKYEEEKATRHKLEKRIKILTTRLQAKTEEAAELTTELVTCTKVFADMVKQNHLAHAAKAVGSATSARSCCGSSPLALPRQTAVQVTQSQNAFSQEAALCHVNESQLPVVSSLQPPAENAFAATGQKYKPIFDVPLSSARVFSIARSCSFLCVGEKFGHDSHGVMMVVAQDPSHRLHVPVHSSAVRDICIHPITGNVLTVAFDGKLAVTDLCQEKVVLEVGFPIGRRQGWSCCFSESDQNAMYCGFQDGTVAKYDMRKPAAGEEGIIKTFLLPERQPVHSIKLFNTSNEGRSTEGLAAATFRGLSVWRDVTNVANEGDQLIASGSTAAAPSFHVSSDQACFSLSSNQLHSDQVVISSRSTPTKHSVFDLRPVGSGQLVPRTEFAGHKTASVLSRSAMWSERNGSLVVASWSHDIECITLWNVARHGEVCTSEPAPLCVASAAVPVVDIQHAVANKNWSSGMALFGAMTSRQLCVYRPDG